MHLEMSRRPAIKPGCRLTSPAAPESLLLIPEGAMRLQGPGRQILELCDGERSLAELITELQAKFSSADPSRISGEVLSFLGALAEKGAVEFK